MNIIHIIRNIIYIKYVNQIDKNINLNKISFHIF